MPPHAVATMRGRISICADERQRKSGTAVLKQHAYRRTSAIGTGDWSAGSFLPDAGEAGQRRFRRADRRLSKINSRQCRKSGARTACGAGYGAAGELAVIKRRVLPFKFPGSLRNWRTILNNLRFWTLWTGHSFSPEFCINFSMVFFWTAWTGQYLQKQLHTQA